MADVGQFQSIKSSAWANNLGRDAVSHIRFPLAFSDQVYNLRSHIDIVRRKMTSRTHALARTPAE